MHARSSMDDKSEKKARAQTCAYGYVVLRLHRGGPKRGGNARSALERPSARLHDAQDLLVAVQERLLAFLRADIPEIHFLPAVVRKQDGVADLDACEVSRGEPGENRRTLRFGITKLDDGRVRKTTRL